MAEIIITSFFTENQVPVNTLTPTIRILDVESGSETLVINNANMTATVEDGFYKYVFTDTNGYDPEKCYVFYVNGNSGTLDEPLQVGEFDTTDSVDAIVDKIYDEPRLDHLVPGSFGEAQNLDRADISNLLLRMTDVELLVSLLLKFETNRTRIDGLTNTMIIYDDDCVTPLRTFQLLDSTGAPSITEMCERRPQASGTSDGLPTC